MTITAGSQNEFNALSNLPSKKGKKIHGDDMDPSTKSKINIIDQQGTTTTYQIDGTIGKGACGKVKKIWNEKTGTLKTVKIQKMASTDIDEIKNEAEIGCLMGYTHGLFFQASSKDAKRNKAYMLNDFIPGQDLEKAMANNSCTINELLIIIRGILGETYRLYQKGVIHADIKPANFILNDEDLSVRVTDYGFSTTLANLEKSEPRGTPKYSPNEVLLGEKNTFKSDFYSAGITCLWLLGCTKEAPITLGPTTINRIVPSTPLQKMLARAYPSLSSKKVKTLSAILDRMTKSSANQRLSGEELKEIIELYDKEILVIPHLSTLHGNIERLVDRVIYTLEAKIKCVIRPEQDILKDALGEKHKHSAQESKIPFTFYALKEKIANASPEEKEDFNFIRQIMGDLRRITHHKLEKNKFTVSLANRIFDWIKKLFPGNSLGRESNLSTGGLVDVVQNEVEKGYKKLYR